MTTEDAVSRQNVKIVRPPNRIASKVQEKVALSPDRTIDKAEKVIADLADRFIETLAGEIDGLELLASEYRKTRSPDILADIANRIHNIRGQGTTFGYPLITDICKSFGNYLQDLPDGVSASVDVVSHHVGAMRAIYRGAVVKADDEIGVAVLRALHALVSKEHRAIERSH